MRSCFVTEQEYAEKAYALAEALPCVSGPKPERFMKMMRENRGDAAAFSPFPLPEDGLERKNPLIVALGDSVTAGHFEFTPDPAKEPEKLGLAGLTPEELMDKVRADPGRYRGCLMEVVDVTTAFPDRFRSKLAEKYGATSVSVVNCGIAGDTILGMEKRLTRDVIRYQPDLILINASLNWFPNCGSNEVYRQSLENVVKRCKAETEADIVLITPNYALPGPFDNPLSTLESRVEIMRSIAKEQDVCLADAYMVWAAFKEAGYPVTRLLANGVNHPSEAGHELFARVLMKLID